MLHHLEGRCTVFIARNVPGNSWDRVCIGLSVEQTSYRAPGESRFRSRIFCISDVQRSGRLCGIPAEDMHWAGH